MDERKVAIMIEFMRRNVGTESIFAFKLKIGRFAIVRPGFALSPRFALGFVFVSEMPVIWNLLLFLSVFIAFINLAETRQAFKGQRYYRGGFVKAFSFTLQNYIASK